MDKLLSTIEKEGNAARLTMDQLKALIAVQQVPANAKQLFSGANIEAFRRTINSDVLRSLLDELPANGSSHRKFRCRDGSTYVIAVHGDRDVGIGLLLKCLRKFGVSAKEFWLKI